MYVDLAKEQFVNSDEPLEARSRRLSNRVQFKFEAWEQYTQTMPNLKDKDIKFSFDDGGESIAGGAGHDHRARREYQRV